MMGTKHNGCVNARYKGTITYFLLTMMMCVMVYYVQGMVWSLQSVIVCSKASWSLYSR